MKILRDKMSLVHYESDHLPVTVIELSETKHLTDYDNTPTITLSVKVEYQESGDKSEVYTIHDIDRPIFEKLSLEDKILVSRKLLTNEA